MLAFIYLDEATVKSLTGYTRSTWQSSPAGTPDEELQYIPQSSHFAYQSARASQIRSALPDPSSLSSWAFCIALLASTDPIFFNIYYIKHNL